MTEHCTPDTLGSQAHSHEADGHGDAQGEHWGNYNSEPPGPTHLPVVSPVALGAFGLALAVLLWAVTSFSLNLATAEQGEQAAVNGAMEVHEAQPR